jgi:hypothetical protein
MPRGLCSHRDSSLFKTLFHRIMTAWLLLAAIAGAVLLLQQLESAIHCECSTLLTLLSRYAQLLALYCINTLKTEVAPHLHSIQY